MSTLWLTLIGLLGAAPADTICFALFPASATIAKCLPEATAEVTVFLKEEILGVDTLQLKASGLPANTTFAVFLTEATAFDTPPFGAVEYIGDFKTNASGLGSLKVDAIIVEAFSRTLVGSQRVRKELDNVVFWFADPAADDFCFAPGTRQGSERTAQLLKAVIPLTEGAGRSPRSRKGSKPKRTKTSASQFSA